MNTTSSYVEAIKNLSVSERILIVEEIWDSIVSTDSYPELSAAECVELNTRSSSYRVDMPGRTWDEIKTDFWRSK
jgi:putative addiction module component (TIGR02574 family)